MENIEHNHTQLYSDEDIYLRPLRMEDAEISWRWRNNPKIWENTLGRPDRVITLEMEKEWMTKVLAETNSLRFAICLRATDQYIGNIYLTDIDWNKHCGWQGTFIGEISFWGKGIGSIARKHLQLIVCQEYGINRIYSRISVKNISSLKSALKTGFEVLNNDGEIMTLVKDL